jgi:hypothetical protein
MWRTTLKGHDTDARFIVNRLRSFRRTHDMHINVNCIALHGNLVARAIYGSFYFYMEFFDWKGSSSLTHYKAILFNWGVKMVGEFNLYSPLPPDSMLVFRKQSISFQGIGFWRYQTLI